MKKYLVAAGIIAATSAAGLTGLSVANAATGNSANDPMSSLVSAIASKFNLKTSDVQAVFDAQKATMDATREQEVKDQIAQLVKDGKLTQAQADALNTKRTALQKEMETNRTSDQSLTSTQRQAKMEERKTATDAWLKAQGIDTQYAYLLMGGGHGHGGPGGPDGQGGRSSSSTTSSSSSSSN